MARFTIEETTITDPDGEERRYAVIKDHSTFERISAPFGVVTVGRGFLRCKGKQYVGTYGQHTPVLVGAEDDVYYSPMAFFDGEWADAGADSRGLHHYVTAASGDGSLFAALEEFANANAVTADN